MHGLTALACRALLERALKHACEARIPRSGEKGRRVNCFIVAVDKAGEPHLVILSISGDSLGCLEYDGSSYAIPRTLPLSQFRPSDFRITHFYGLSEIRYFGLLDFAINQLSRWPYFKLFSVKWIDRYAQYLFNKKKLVAKKRIDLLKFMLDKALDGTEDFDSLDLVIDLYSLRWISHPTSESLRQTLDFYLESLVDTGELRKANHNYRLTGEAVRAIEEYEEQERKHTENVKMQWRMFFLTLAIVALTLVQAGLIKLPVLLDLRK
jgi:hypothetical protein